MNLKEWRLTRELTMADAAAVLGVDSARTYQRYEIGENRPDAPLVERIRKVTENAVTLEDVHVQRLDWLRENKPEVFVMIAEAAE